MAKPGRVRPRSSISATDKSLRNGVLLKEDTEAALIRTGDGLVVEILNQLKQQVEHQTNIGEMSGGIAQPDAEFRGNAQQAGRDFYQYIIDARPSDTAVEPGANNKTEHN